MFVVWIDVLSWSIGAAWAAPDDYAVLLNSSRRE